MVEKKSERTSPDGKTTITIWQPGKWTYSAMAQLIEALSKIGRLSAGLSTSNASRKIETLDRDRQEQPPMSADEQAAHEYAAREAEDTYFEAYQEWHERQHYRNHIAAQVIE